MMKHLVFATALAGVFAALAATYIPKGNAKQYAASPLEKNEVSWTPAEGGAELFVGGGSGVSLRVVDPAALRGSRVALLPQGAYSVAADPAFTHDPVNGTYTTSSAATNAIIITVPGHYQVTDYSYDVTDPNAAALIPARPYSDIVKDGNTATIYAAKGEASSCKIYNIKVYAKAYGDGDGFTDLTHTTFLLKDSLGTYDFANLRDQLLRRYDGNRGQDWYKYDASNAVNLAGSPLRFNRNGDYTMRITANTNLVIQKNEIAAMTISEGAHNGIDYTYFQITQIDATGANGTGTVLTYAHDIVGFDMSALVVQVCADLNEGIWYALAEDEVTVTPDTIVIKPTSARMQCYRLKYYSAISDSVRVTFRGTVVIRDAIVIRGTDGKYYKLKINNGAISAEEVTL